MENMLFVTYNLSMGLDTLLMQFFLTLGVRLCSGCDITTVLINTAVVTCTGPRQQHQAIFQQAALESRRTRARWRDSGMGMGVPGVEEGAEVDKMRMDCLHI